MKYVGHKKAPDIQGSGVAAHSPSSCRLLRRNWHPSCIETGGLPGFVGPFPSTSLDESDLTQNDKFFNVLSGT
jgi:hypothetical protein